jgi:F1F0 ATPase subunit 2
MSAASWIRSAVALAAGGAAGAAFFALLRTTVGLYGTRRWPLGIALHLARWALLAAVLVAAARAGAAPLLAAAAGTLLARAAVLRARPEAAS